MYYYHKKNEKIIISVNKSGPFNIWIMLSFILNILKTPY